MLPVLALDDARADGVDPNPIENLFPRILETVTAAECANYFAEAGYDPI